MYHLQTVDQSNWSDYPILVDLYNDLPDRPYCTNAKGDSFIRSKKTAINHYYIQPNHPAVIRWLVFDIDDSDALFAYYDNNAPPPNIVTRKTENGHCHVCFRVAVPVDIWHGTKHTIDYLISVQVALNKLLGGDKNYSANLMQSPFSGACETYIVRAEPYSLSELAEHLDLEVKYGKKETVAVNDEGFGRNVNIFNHTRYHAYKIANSMSYQALYSELLEVALKHNSSMSPKLSKREIEHIVKSITKFCKSARFSYLNQSNSSAERFSELQRARAKTRWGDSTNKQEKALKMHLKGVKKTKIAEELGVTTKTLTRWGLRKNKK